MTQIKSNLSFIIPWTQIFMLLDVNFFFTVKQWFCFYSAIFYFTITIRAATNSQVTFSFMSRFRDGVPETSQKDWSDTPKRHDAWWQQHRFNRRTAIHHDPPCTRTDTGTNPDGNLTTGTTLLSNFSKVTQSFLFLKRTACSKQTLSCCFYSDQSTVGV